MPGSQTQRKAFDRPMSVAQCIVVSTTSNLRNELVSRMSLRSLQSIYLKGAEKLSTNRAGCIYRVRVGVSTNLNAIQLGENSLLVLPRMYANVYMLVLSVRYGPSGIHAPKDCHARDIHLSRWHVNVEDAEVNTSNMEA